MADDDHGDTSTTTAPAGVAGGFSTRRCLALGLASGVLCGFAIPPAPVLMRLWDHPPDLGPFLAWFAFVPVLVALWRTDRARAAAAAGFAFGFAWFGLSILFLMRVHWLAFVLSTIGYGLLTMLFVLVVFAFRRRHGRFGVFTVLLLWVATDWLYATVGVKFPWLFAAHMVINDVPLAQTADLLGVWGTSAIILFVNLATAGLLATWATHEEHRRFWKRTLVAAVALAIAGHIYGWVRPDATREGPVLAMLQANIPQSIKKDFHLGQQKQMERLYTLLAALRQIHRAKGVREIPVPPMDPDPPAGRADALYVLQRTGDPIDLIVFPETSLPYRYELARHVMAHPEKYADVPWVPGMVRGIERLHADIADLGIPVQLGCLEFPPDMDIASLPKADLWGGEHPRCNASHLVLPDGTLAGTYYKIELVPVGEYVPLGEELPVLAAFTRTVAGYLPQYVSGDGIKPLAVAGYTYTPAICFETNFPWLNREYARAGVDFVLVQSNDGWFLPSAELEQIWIGTRYRAIENRLGYVRTVNSGVSGCVGPDGAFHDRFAVDGMDQGLGGVLITRIPTGTGKSLYVLVGDIFPQAAFGFSVLALLWIGMSSFRTRSRWRWRQAEPA